MDVSMHHLPLCAWKMRDITVYEDEGEEIVIIVSVYMACKDNQRQTKIKRSDQITKTSH